MRILLKKGQTSLLQNFPILIALSYKLASNSATEGCLKIQLEICLLEMDCLLRSWSLYHGMTSNQQSNLILSHLLDVYSTFNEG